ncbi:solute carrier organic anion transporter family member 4A1-like [Diaphorina citri]|uniref:Solute carrier organic anion transporter family member 4A1-like n=1 Tax=Diaphorina citri TaxID=121845 RepID=A0A1S3DBS6_DIACI|nr:solute carrier organic anion transporter family member 4A1-like [Diaphorina citri]
MTNIKDDDEGRKNEAEYRLLPEKVNGNGNLNVEFVNSSSHKNGNGYKSSYEVDEDMKCGLGPCTPNWMQVFTNKKAFLFTFCITWVLQGMYYTYFVSVITTIEKLFQVQSKTTGIIMSATEIGQIGSSLLLTYYGGQGHRPRWIAWGMVLFAASSFICALPHFIFGDQPLNKQNLIFQGDNGTIDLPPNLCYIPPSLTLSGNITMHDTSLDQCHKEKWDEQQAQSQITTIVLVIFFISLLGVGMGQTAVYTLGIPYIDDYQRIYLHIPPEMLILIFNHFSNCTCMSGMWGNGTILPDPLATTASLGPCENDCVSVKWYIILFSFFVFIHSTSEVGSMLLILRCVDPSDKAMALGLIQFAIGLFGNVPCPIVYGAVVDSACLVWESVCGEKGACNLYDTDVFRVFYHGTTGFILLLAFFVDTIVWYKAGSINFADEETNTPEDDEMQAMTEKIKPETCV